MAFASKLGLGARHGALLSSSLGLRRSNARLFSSLLQNSTATRAARAPFAPRFLSTSNSPVAPSAEEPISAAVTPEASSIVTDSVEAISAAAAHIPPLQYGDLSSLGLIGWNPAGLIRWSFEVLNVATGMPWFWTIVAGTVCWRIFCVPFTIISMRESALLQPHQKEFTRLREDFTRASTTGSPLEKMKAQTALATFQKEKGINPLKSMYGLVQLPVTLGLFFGVQKMAKLPVEQLKESGIAAIPDLTVPDPTYIMPAVLMAVVNAQISLGAKDLDMQERPGMAHLMNALRVFSVAGFFVMTDFSAALVVSLLTTSTFTLLQTFILQRPVVRALLDIPIIPKSKQGRLPTFKESFEAARTYFKTGGISSTVPTQQRINQFQRPRKL